MDSMDGAELEIGLPLPLTVGQKGLLREVCLNSSQVRRKILVDTTIFRCCALTAFPNQTLCLSGWTSPAFRLLCP